MFGLFAKTKKNTASTAKSRLKIAIKKDANANPILNVIEDEVIEAIKQYTKVNPDNIETNLEKEIELMRVNCELEDEKKNAEETFFEKFFSKKSRSASVAKDRLMFAISKQATPKFSEALERDVKSIIKRYIKNNPENVKIELINDEGVEFLELNITLPEDFDK